MRRVGVVGGWVVAFVGVGMALSGSAAAQSETSNVPQSAFFLGAGANYSFTTFAGQSVYNKGLSTVFQSGVLSSTGSADGPAVATPLDPQSNAAPVVQLGYFRHFRDSKWLWGAKLSYSYVGTTSSLPNLVIPQYGVSNGAGPSTFTGYSVTGSYTVSVYHETSFMPFVGRQFDNSFIYAGVGPSISQVQASLNNVVGYATINGRFTDVSGTPQSFSSTNWNLGGAATVGLTYFLGPSWFLDLNYAVVMPNARGNYAASPFFNQDGTNTYIGTLIGTYTANLITQSIGLTINKTF